LEAKLKKEKKKNADQLYCLFGRAAVQKITMQISEKGENFSRDQQVKMIEERIIAIAYQTLNEKEAKKIEQLVSTKPITFKLQPSERPHPQENR
jgi:accessory colonization factor AcfC